MNKCWHLLAERGIQIAVGGCGCCDSPWLEIRVDGKTVYDKDRSDLSNIPEE